MTITPGIPEDWADTNPESTTPERILPTPEGVLRPPEPVLPRRIKPEDVRVGMVVECRDLVRVTAVHSGIIEADRWEEFMADAESETCERQWWLIEDAPEPVDPDAEATDADTEDAVYLSGPMTGLPDFNRPAFHAAAAALRAQGYVVINPAEVDLGLAATWVDYMRIHLAEIARRVTQVFVLPGWESSRGAQLEVHVARSLGLPVVPAPEPVDPDAELVERMARAMDAEPGFNVSDMAYAALRALREIRDVTPRAVVSTDQEDQS